jgi:hypothetical protein
MSSLQGAIKGLPCKRDDYMGWEYWCGYEDGHRSCRLLAANLALAADKRIEELESTLRLAEQYIHLTDCYGTGECYSKDVLDIIKNALGEQQ